MKTMLNDFDFGLSAGLDNRTVSSEGDPCRGRAGAGSSAPIASRQDGRFRAEDGDVWRPRREDESGVVRG